MTTPKHTPGPWRVGDAGHTIFGPPNGKPAPDIIASVLPQRSITMEQRKANAKLLAAAPELLASCEAAIASCVETPGEERCSIHRDAVQALVNAIHKATKWS